MSTDLIGSMDEVRAGLAAALEAEDRRYAAVVAAVAAEHDAIVSHISGALAALSGEGDVIVVPTGTNGHGKVDTEDVVDPAVAAALGVDVILPAEPGEDDEEPGEVVDLGAMTMEDAILAIMSTKPGVVWKAEDVQAIMAANGAVSSKLSSIRAALSIAYRNGKLDRPIPGEYISKAAS
jgi:hypothetical protein